MPNNSNNQPCSDTHVETRNAADKTVAYLRQLISTAPKYVDAYRRLAETLESMHRIEEAAETVTTGLTIASQDPGLNVLAAKLERRKGQSDLAIERLEKIIPCLKDDIVGQGALTEYGLLLDQINRPTDAMPAFERANQIAAQLWVKNNPGPNQALAAIRHQLEIIDRTWASQWLTHTITGSDLRDPIFLIGFPRSGTTLVDQILSAHEGFQVMEELPVIAQVESELVQSGCTSPEDWPQLPASLLKQARHSYWTKVESVYKVKSRHLFVDKMPLATRRIPVIHRLFPNAKILFVQRHPFDVCLSCFMQSFQPNPAMANFFSLETTAQFYASTMDLWLSCIGLLPIDYHVIKYESLIDNLEHETRNLTDFIGIDWSPDMLNYFDHARQRSGLKTPSYDQVTRPIYDTSRYRWQRYAPFLDKVKPVLDPYITAFGYGDMP